MQDQPVRQHMDPDGAAQIEAYVAKIESLLSLAHPFHVVSLSLKTFQCSTRWWKFNWFCVCVVFCTKSGGKARPSVLVSALTCQLSKKFQASSLFFLARFCRIPVATATWRTLMPRVLILTVKSRILCEVVSKTTRWAFTPPKRSVIRLCHRRRKLRWPRQRT